MSCSPGYEYEYSLSMQEQEELGENELELSKGRGIVFEFRTEFLMKGRSGKGRSIDSERFIACFAEGKTSRMHLEFSAGYRLFEYSMPCHKIDALIEEAAQMAQRLLLTHSQLRVIPILVQINVCTLQLEDEDPCKALSRAITPRDLQPFDHSASNLFSK